MTRPLRAAASGALWLALAVLAVLACEHPCDAAVVGRWTPLRKALRLMALQGPCLFEPAFGAATIAASFPQNNRHGPGRALARWDGVTCDAATAVYAVLLEITFFWGLQVLVSKAGGALARVLFKHRWGGLEDRCALVAACDSARTLTTAILVLALILSLGQHKTKQDPPPRAV
jgi:hypothetical protein